MNDKLLELVLVTLKDVKRQFAKQQVGRDVFAKYRTLIVAYSKIYNNHLGTNNSFRKLKDRFILETAILYVITYIGNMSGSIPKQNSPIYQSDSLYSWYQPSRIISIDAFLESLKESKNPEIELIDACHQILSQLAGRHIGEFYTPVSLVEHLIKVSELKPQDILKGSDVVDPACGGGMILVRIAQKYFEYCHKRMIPASNAAIVLNDKLYGFDIQPFAIFLTRTMLIWVMGKYLPGSSIDFRNVQLMDPLIQTENFWISPKFDYVISNPPFMVIKRNSNEFLDSYSEIIHGHPNLYSLFIWWAIKASKLIGTISLLVPQSMLAGAYFESLRNRIASETTLKSVTRLIERKGAIQYADQQMMIIALQRNNQKITNTVSVKIAKNSSVIRKNKPTKIPYKSVLRDSSFASMWVVSDSILDYEIEEAAFKGSKILRSISDFKLGNGGYVWNQNKESLIDQYEPGSIPLISSASISRFLFTFPHNGNHPSKNRSFSKLTSNLEQDVKTGQLLLIQRTTPRKIGRRLIGCIIDQGFTEKHKRFFLENHVNYIMSQSEEPCLLFGLLGWLNSDLINFVFQLRNGSTQVSIFELSLLPINNNMLIDLAPLAQAASLSTNKEKSVKEINNLIYKGLNISTEQQQRIEQVLNWKE